jgi:hypothetical protein
MIETEAKDAVAPRVKIVNMFRIQGVLSSSESKTECACVKGEEERERKREGEERK